MPEQPIGLLLDGLEVTIDLADGNGVSAALSDSTGMSWLDQLGLIATAQQTVNDGPFTTPT